MFDPTKVRFGIAPYAWFNDDMPDIGKNIPYEQCLSEAALAGFEGCELAFKFPHDVALLKRRLAIRKLEILTGWFSSYILQKPIKDAAADFIAHRDRLHGLGCKVICVSEQTYSLQGIYEQPIFEGKHVMDDIEWKKLSDGLNYFGELANERNMTVVYHHHMGTVVQDEAEIDRLMQMTDPAKVSLLYDTGHLQYAGVDHLKILERYMDRIKHVHLKDLHMDKIEQLRREHLSFMKGIRLGAFTIPGDGDLDFITVFKILEEHGYEGWIEVEVEQDPEVVNPLETAVAAREYIRKYTGI